MCMGTGLPMGMGIPRESHGNGNKTHNWEWEWEGMGNHLNGYGNYLHCRGNLFSQIFLFAADIFSGMLLYTWPVVHGISSADSG